MSFRFSLRAARVVALGAALCPHAAQAQFSNQTGNVAGTAGGACVSASNDYAWPDANGNVLKCVSNVWTVQGVTATAAGSTGYVQFNNAGALGASSNLFWDNTNYRLGIGTTSPGANLDIQGASVNNGPPLLQMIQTGAGSAGFFRITNGSLLSSQFAPVFWGRAKLSSSSSAGAGVVFQGDLPYDTAAQMGIEFQATLNGTGALTTASAFQFYNYSTPLMTIAAGGNVGIGTTSPVATLDVRSSSTYLQYLIAPNDAWHAMQIGVNGQNDMSIGVEGSGGGGFFTNGVGNAGAIGTFSNHGLELGTNNTVKVYITNTGNVGIGTTTPSYGLEIAGTTGAVTERISGGGLAIGDGSGFVGFHPTHQVPGNHYFTGMSYSNAGGWITVNGEAGRINLNFSNNALYPLAFNSSNWNGSAWVLTERMRIDGSTGNVGIGSTAPVASLDLSQKSDALALPGGSNAQRPTGGALVNGEIRYNTAGTGQVEAYYNGAWNALVTSATLGTATPAAGSTGQVQFNSGGYLGASSNLFWNNSSGYLGIGTTSPNVAGFGNSTVVTVQGSSASSSKGVIELSTAQADANSLVTGVLDYVFPAAASGYRELAQISAVTDGTTATQRGGDLVFATQTNGTAGASERMRITSSGNVGIGTTSPTQLLHVYESAASGDVDLRVANPNVSATGAVLTSYVTSAREWVTGVGGASHIYAGKYFIYDATAAATRMLIDSSGNVGIGTAGPASTLDVNGTIRSVGRATPSSGKGLELFYDVGQDFSGLISYDRSGSAYKPLTYNGVDQRFYFSGTEKIRFDSSGNVGIGTTAPSAKLDIRGGGLVVDTPANSGSIMLREPSAGAAGRVITAVTGTAGLLLGDIDNKFSDVEIRSNGQGTGSGITLAWGSVGIGLNSPANKLDVNGAVALGSYAGTAAPSNGLIVSGNVGIGVAGTASSGNKLEVNGGTTFLNNTGNTELTLNAASSNYVNFYDTGTGGIAIGGTGSVGPTPSYPVMFWNVNTGNVGIGSTIPVASLDLSQKTDALALPGGSNAQRPTGGALVNGEIRYNTAGTGQVEAYYNGAWNSLVTSATAGTASPAAGSTGYVQFNNAGALGASSSFYWDNTNGWLGIGTASPAGRLDITAPNITTPDLIARAIAAQTSNLIEGHDASNNTVVGISKYGDYQAMNASNSNYISIRSGAATSTTPWMQFHDQGVYDANITMGTVNGVNGLVFSVPISVTGFLAGGLVSTAGIQSKSTATGVPSVGILDLWSEPGTPSFVAFSERTVANRGIIGFPGGSGDLVFRSNGATSMSNGSEYFRITSGGNVGIGTTAPTAALQVNTSDTTPSLILSNTGTGGTNWNLYSTNNTFAQGGGKLLIRGGATDRVVIDLSTGNVGIGTTSPNNLLDVENASGSSVVQIGDIGTGAYIAGTQLYSGGAVKGSFLFRNSSASLEMNNYVVGPLLFGTSSAERMRIDASGNVGIGTTSPGNNLQVGSVAGVSTSTPTTLSLGGSFSSTAGANPKLKLYDTGGSTIYGLGVSSYSLDFIVPASSGFNFYPNASSTSAVTFASSGNVGIGTTSPADMLEIHAGIARLSSTSDGNNGLIRFYDQTGAQRLQIGPSSPDSTAFFWTPSGTSLKFSPGGVESVRFASNGNVGIGTAAPSSLLHLLAPSGSDTTVRIDRYATNHSALTSYDTSGVATAADPNWTTGKIYNTNDFSVSTWDGSATIQRVVVQANTGNVGIGSTVPVASLDISQKNDALALPGGSNAQRPTGGALVNGEIRYNNTGSGSVEAYYNSTWNTLGGAGGTPAGSNGQVQFNNSGAFGASSSFSWDNSNGRLGIGTTAPRSALDTYQGRLTFDSGVTYGIEIGAANSTGKLLRFDQTSSGTLALQATSAELPPSSFKDLALQPSSGKVGVGTITPGTILHVSGYTLQNGQNTTLALDSGGASTETGLQFLNGGTKEWDISSRGTFDLPNNRLAVFDNSLNERLTFLQSGNVGIGSTIPAATLDVNGNISAESGGFVTAVANAGTTGTTVNKLAKINSSGQAVIAATTDADNMAGVVIGGAGTTGSAQIVVDGQASCVFDGATTAGHYVTISSATAGDCSDAGATRPTSSQMIGRVLSTNGGGGTYAMVVSLGKTGNLQAGVTRVVTSGASCSSFAVGTLATDSSGDVLVCDNTPSTLSGASCTGFNPAAQTYDIAGGIYVCAH